MAAPETTTITLQILAALGVLSQANLTLLDYSNLLATASAALKTTKQLAGAATNQLIDFAVLFPGLTAGSTKLIYIREITGTTMNGFKVRQSNNGTAVNVIADSTGSGGIWLMTSDSLPQIYVDNRSGLNTTYLEIGVLGA